MRTLFPECIFESVLPGFIYDSFSFCDDLSTISTLIPCPTDLSAVEGWKI